MSIAELQALVSRIAELEARVRALEAKRETLSIPKRG